MAFELENENLFMMFDDKMVENFDSCQKKLFANGLGSALKILINFIKYNYL